MTFFFLISCVCVCVWLNFSFSPSSIQVRSLSMFVDDDDNIIMLIIIMLMMMMMIVVNNIHFIYPVVKINKKNEFNYKSESILFIFFYHNEKYLKNWIQKVKKIFFLILNFSIFFFLPNSYTCTQWNRVFFQESRIKHTQTHRWMNE